MNTPLYKQRDTIYLATVVIVSCFLLLWERGVHDISEWDEARNGVNAWHMYFNHDYINYYYGNKIDTWSSKPPLMIWSILLSYKLFGFNEFALRFPAFLSTLVFFIVFYKLVTKYTSSITALFTCLILMSCKAIISWHVGRTGDFDSMLLLFLILSLYSFSSYLTDKNIKGLYWAALFIGLAFYTKGTAAFLYLPGFVLLLIWKNKFLALLKSKHFYFSFMLLIGIVLSWVYLAITYSKYPAVEQTSYGTHNSIESMFMLDTFDRLTNEQFASAAVKDYLFFFHNIEMRMNLWNYVFYLCSVMGIVLFYKNKNQFLKYINTQKMFFAVLSVCMSLPIILVINFSAKPYSWYLTPVWPFIAFLTAYGMIYMQKKWRPFSIVWVLFILLNLVKHFDLINNKSEGLHNHLTRANPVLSKLSSIILLKSPQENILLYLNWMNMGFETIRNKNLLNEHIGEIALVHKDDMSEQLQKLQSFGEYHLCEIESD